MLTPREKQIIDLAVETAIQTMKIKLIVKIEELEQKIEELEDSNEAYRQANKYI